MRTLSWPIVLTALCVACSNQGQSGDSATAAPPQAPAAQPYGTLAEVMRGIPFPHSNIIFDTQEQDPAAPKKPSEGGAGATLAYANVYAGWQAVENSAMALSETANLIMIPGRLCENGLPVPLEREDYRKAAQGLAAYKAAKARNLDAMVEISGTVADACAACHEVYRDKPEGKQRCIP
jgi:hypothetical protein